MKRLILSALACIAFSSIFASVTITAVANDGNWSTNSTWDLNRQPAEGDIVIIPFGRIVTLNNNVSFVDLYINVYGTLKLAGGKIRIGNTSSIFVFQGGKIKGNGTASDQIRMETNLIWQGIDGDIIGPEMASLSANTFVPFVPLPVTFIGFTATRTSNDNLIEWSTSEERNTSNYQLERSYDGTNWSAITKIAAAGTTTAVNHYSFLDRNNFSATTYYRVKQVDIDGQFVYTPVKSVKGNDNPGDIRIASVESNILLQFPEKINGSVMVRVIAMNGQVVQQQTITRAIGEIIINTSFKGDCVVSVSNGNSIHAARQIIL
ncbi:MAG TPA: hypothetical protein VNR87_15495 [Flavisolibacter sp.]|nr:hypothetical protein [Flavisolibacter sp.]